MSSPLYHFRSDLWPSKLLGHPPFLRSESSKGSLSWVVQTTICDHLRSPSSPLQHRFLSPSPNPIPWPFFHGAPAVEFLPNHNARVFQVKPRLPLRLLIFFCSSPSIQSNQTILSLLSHLFLPHLPEELQITSVGSCSWGDIRSVRHLIFHLPGHFSLSFVSSRNTKK